MNNGSFRGDGADVQGAVLRNVRMSAGRWRTVTGLWNRLSGLLGGAVLGTCLLAGGGAEAYQQVSGPEGGRIEIRYSLPAFPHEARRYSPGYSAVRYKLCTKDGTAKGIHVPIAAMFFGGGQDFDPDLDYLGVCELQWTLNSNNNYNKQLVLEWKTREDDRVEGDEYFWLYLTDPEVMRPGSNTWQSHSGSHHVPLKIEFQLTIEDND